MDTRIFDWKGKTPETKDLKELREILQNDGCVVFPTETVFGIGANALSDTACGRIFSIKGRPGDNPLIVHVSSFDMLDKVAYLDIAMKEKLSIFWPGPLTAILRNRSASRTATAGLDTVGIRMPLHHQARALIESAGIPIAAPSANLASRPSITRNSDALNEFMGKVEAIVLGEEPTFGLESTVIDPQSKPARILRSGSYTREDLETVFPGIELFAGKMDRPPTPGMKYRHYSPRKPLFLVRDTGRFVSIARSIDSKSVPICTQEIGEAIARDFISLGNGEDLRTVARNLFAALNAFDGSQYEKAYIHGIPETGIGVTIMNRITKASIEI